MLDRIGKTIGNFNGRTIEIILGKKTLKKGVMVNWKCHPFFIEINIDTGVKIDKVKIFYPFSVEMYGDNLGDEPMELYLDYRLSTFNKQLGTTFDTSEYPSTPVHKFFNSILTIKEIE